MTCAAAVQAVPFLKALSADESRAEAAPAGPAMRTAAIVAEHIARGRPTVAEVQDLLGGLKSAHPQLLEVVIRGLAEGWPKDHRIVATKELEASLTGLLERVPAGARGKLLQLASLCGSKALDSYAKEIIESLLKVVTDAGAATDERVNAAREAVVFQSENAEILTAVLSAITPMAAPE
ncbi:MAG: hypothetical protein ACKPJJ_11150, partial [Planctomycetaceae bacterium]